MLGALNSPRVKLEPLNQIKSLRQRRGLLQRELAERIGCMQSDISAYERGQVPTLPRALDLTNALGCPLQALFFGLDRASAERVCIASATPAETTT